MMRLKEHNKRYSYTLDHGNTIIQGIGIAIIYIGMLYMSSSTGCTQKAIGCKLDILSSKLLVERVVAIGFRSIGLPKSVFTFIQHGVANGGTMFLLPMCSTEHPLTQQSIARIDK